MGNASHHPMLCQRPNLYTLLTFAAELCTVLPQLVCARANKVEGF